VVAPVSPERWEQIKRLFFAACECDGAMRESLLARETRDDPSLRKAVESLLSSASAATFFERSPVLRASVEEDPRMADGGTTLPALGGYQALRVIGVGGTSTVYEAVQDNPRRTVALKVLRTSLASTSMQQRFEWESRILARLRHPAIAQVHAAGIQESGVDRTPYFVMEHIPGAEPITQFAAGRALDRRQRLEIFIRVCDAVQHAHQQGIIHRDLKPGNILVDAGGHPKVIDFGVARVVTDETGFSSVHTQPGQIIGTLAYMSPEQCGHDPDSLDTRTDIYSLGVVLYELLCGQRPHDVYGTAFLEAVRMIREDPAPRLARHDPSLRGDLETIVHKAMEKDPERRYSSPAALAEDIGRYLNREPITARPPSSVYYLRKLVARHRAVSALLLLCIS
jgi:serine/threonine protein kinase